MNPKHKVVYPAVLIVIFLIVPPFAHGFMGDYISTVIRDSAVIATLKSSDTDYESDDTEAGDIDRKIFSIGLSRSIAPNVKIAGSLNYAFSGEMGGNGGDLESGFSCSAGAGYTFWDQSPYSALIYGHLSYTFEETFKYPDRDMDLTLDGYELIIGVMGKYNFYPHLYAFTAFQTVAFQDYTMDISGPTDSYTWDLEKKERMGIKVGLFYEYIAWFTKGEVEVGGELALSLSTGMKF